MAMVACVLTLPAEQHHFVSLALPYERKMPSVIEPVNKLICLVLSCSEIIIADVHYFQHVLQLGLVMILSVKSS